MKIADVLNQKQKIDKFYSWVCKELGIVDKPEIVYSDDLDQVEDKRTFGTTDISGKIWVYCGPRNPADIMRTLCHELVHYVQFSEGLADENMSDDRRQSIEDVANAIAGRLLRKYGQLNPEIYS